MADDVTDLGSQQTSVPQFYTTAGVA